jgi:hypothetical protein
VLFRSDTIIFGVRVAFGREVGHLTIGLRVIPAPSTIFADNSRGGGGAFGTADVPAVAVTITIIGVAVVAPLATMILAMERTSLTALALAVGDGGERLTLCMVFKRSSAGPLEMSLDIGLLETSVKPVQHFLMEL